jgi:FkbM family methyltransferase
MTSLSQRVKVATASARQRLAGRLWPAGISYSAYGEDLLAWHRVTERFKDPTRITYLDIGAGPPVAPSNTFLFYRHGAHGVLMEPDPDQARNLRARRPRDIVIEAGAAFDGRRTASLNRMAAPVFNTFSDARAQEVGDASRGWEARQHVVDKVEVQLVPINEIIERQLKGDAPHFLSIDAESCDFAILRSLDLARFRPLVVCVEAAQPLADYEALLTSAYFLIGRTPDNFLFALH